MTWTVRLGPAALTIRRSSAVYCLVTSILVIVVGILTLTLGRLGIAVADLPAALLGQADGSSGFVLERLRGPRLATAALAGALLGVSGALFQTVTRNPLGSPDVIGLGAGAGAGAAVLTLVLPAAPAFVGAVAGAALATLAVYLSTGRGFRSPTRTIIAGIAVAALAYAITQYVVSVHLREAASQLAAYLVGSLNAASARDVLVSLVAVAVLVPVAAAVGRDVSMLELGDDVAAGVGVDPDRVRTVAVVVSVLAAGAAVAATGPVAFVALTAPQISRRITRSAEVSIGSSALTGALVLTLADLAAQQAPYVSGLPVGILTLGVGGLYLGYLLVRERTRGRL